MGLLQCGRLDGGGWLKKKGDDCGSMIQNHGVDPHHGPGAVLRAFASPWLEFVVSPTDAEKGWCAASGRPGFAICGIWNAARAEAADTMGAGHPLLPPRFTPFPRPALFFPQGLSASSTTCPLPHGSTALYIVVHGFRKGNSGLLWNA